MNQPYAHANQSYATLTLASALREMFGVQLYKNNARALLSRILSFLNLDWLQHARSVRGVYEWTLLHLHGKKMDLIMKPRSDGIKHNGKIAITGFLDKIPRGSLNIFLGTHAHHSISKLNPKWRHQW